MQGAIKTQRCDGPDGADREDGGSARGGDLQRQHVLHVPHREAALLQLGSESGDLRDRPGPEGGGPLQGAAAPPRRGSACADRLHRGEARRGHRQCDGVSYQRLACAAA